MQGYTTGGVVDEQITTPENGRGEGWGSCDFGLTGNPLGTSLDSRLKNIV